MEARGARAGHGIAVQQPLGRRAGCLGDGQALPAIHTLDATRISTPELGTKTNES